jgi:hypothetical protein
VIANGHSGIPTLAAGLRLAAPGRGAGACRTVCNPETRVGGFCCKPSGRKLRRGRFRPINTPGWRVCGYKTASGRADWPNRDPLGERWGINLYQFVRNNSVNTIDSDGRIAVLPIMIAGGVCGVFFTPATVNAPGPNDPVYPALTVDEVCVNALCGATFAGGIGIVSSKICPPPPAIKPTLCPVSRWGTPDLQPNYWVMLGPKSPCNYVLSGKWQPCFGNQFASYSSGITHNVPPPQLLAGHEGAVLMGR